MGRPLSFTSDVKEEICSRLMTGLSLRKICAEDSSLPCQTTIYKELAADPEFAKQYARAREVQADALFDEILEIADESSRDTTVDQEGNVKVDQEVVARSRIRIDARKWMAGKLRPKLYGEKIATELSGPNGGAIEVSEIVRKIVDPKA